MVHPQLRNFWLFAGVVTPFVLVSPYLLEVKCCGIAQNLRRDHVYTSLLYIYKLCYLRYFEKTKFFNAFFTLSQNP